MIWMVQVRHLVLNSTKIYNVSLENCINKSLQFHRMGDDESPHVCDFSWVTTTYLSFLQLK